MLKKFRQNPYSSRKSSESGIYFVFDQARYDAIWERTIADPVELEGLFQLQNAALSLLPVSSVAAPTKADIPDRESSRTQLEKSVNVAAASGSGDFTRGRCQYCCGGGTIRQELKEHLSKNWLNLSSAAWCPRIDSLDQLFVQVYV